MQTQTWVQQIAQLYTQKPDKYIYFIRCNPDDENVTNYIEWMHAHRAAYAIPTPSGNEPRIHQQVYKSRSLYRKPNITPPWPPITTYFIYATRALRSYERQHIIAAADGIKRGVAFNVFKRDKVSVTFPTPRVFIFADELPEHTTLCSLENVMVIDVYQ